MTLRAIALLALLAATCQRGAEPPRPPPPPPVAELWVDGSAPEGGDGSRERPIKALGQALAGSPRPLWIHLASGLYPGPFELAGGVALEGVGTVVLHADAGVVVRASGVTSFAGLTIQGGATGIESDGELVLERVALSGQREVALRMTRGSARLERAQFQASVSETRGLVLEGGTTAAVRDSAFLGPYRRAVDARGGSELTVEGCRFDGPVTGLNQVEGRATVRRSAFSGGRGAAIFSASGALRLEDVRVHGHEYALQARKAWQLRVRGFASDGAERAAIALLESRAEIEDALLLGSGSFGAVQLIASEVSLRRFWIHRAEAYGVVARGGTLTLTDGVVSRVTDPGDGAGDGVLLRQTTARIEAVSILDAAGSGLHAAEAARVQVRAMTLERCRWGGVLAETLAQVEGASVIVRSSAAAVVVPDEARVRLDALVAERSGQGPIWAECARGADVALVRSRSDGAPLPHSPCGAR